MRGTFPVVMNFSLRNSTVTALILVACAHADETQPWEVTGAAGLSASSGNSDNLAYYLQLLATYQNNQNEGSFGVDYFVSESDKVKTTNSFRTFGQYNHLLTDRFYLGLVGEFLVDPIADIDYRFDLAPVAGYKFIKNDTTSLSFEAGPGYTWQEEDGVTDDFSTVRFAQTFEHSFNARTKLWQNITFTPKKDDFSDSVLRGEIGLDLRLNDEWALRTSLRHKVDSNPATGREKDDTTLLVGFTYELGGIPEPEEAGRDTLKKAPEPKTVAPLGWTTTAGTGLSFARGNSESTNFHLNFSSAYREKRFETFYDLGYSFAEDGDSTSEDRLTASARINRTPDECNFYGAGLSFLRDDLADISYRLTPALVAGRYLIKNDTLTLSLEAGPSYRIEEVAGETDSFFSVTAAERLSWAINDYASLKQEIVANLSAENADNFTIVASARLETDFTSDLSWTLGLEYLYDNQPAAGLKKNDTSLKTGIAIRF